VLRVSDEAGAVLAERRLLVRLGDVAPHHAAGAIDQ
jgi:hypothetical protein